MPLLPRTRRDLDDLNEVEVRMDQWVDELGNIVVTSIQYMASLNDSKARLIRIRRGFQDARANMQPVMESR